MEPKSKNVTTRFSVEEFEKIKEYMKKYKIKSPNDFIRKSVGFLISFVEGMANIAESPEINEAVDKFNRELKTELDKVPAKKAKLRGKYQSFEKEILPKFEAEIKKGVIHAEPFAKKRKAGRPKTPKRKRGDRKELGHGK